MIVVVGEGAGVDRVVGMLLGPLAERVRGAASASDYLVLIVSLVFVRTVASAKWLEQRRDAGALRSVDEAKLMLRRIGELADLEFRRMDVAAGVGGHVARLQPHNAADVASVIRLSEGVGRSAFRTLLERYEVGGQLRGSQSFTPMTLRRLMVKLVARDSAVSVYDPYARSGELLLAASDELNASTVRGESPDPAMVWIAVVNLLLHGRSGEFANTTAAPWEKPGQHRADIVLCNPPFNAVALTADEGKWRFGPPPSNNNNLAWLQYIFSLLADDGYAVVVMANNAMVSANPREREIRNQLVQAGVVECVIGLGPRMFLTTAVPISLWVLSRRERPRDEILFIDARRRGKRAGKQLALTDEDIAEITAALVQWRKTGRCERDNCASVKIGEISGPEYSLSPTDYVVKKTHGVGAGQLRDMIDEETRLRAVAERADAAVRGLSVRAGGPWQKVSLDSLCEIQAGPSPKHFKAGVTPRAGVPVVLPKHIKGRRVVADEPDEVTEARAEQLDKFRLRRGDLVTVRTGSTGHTALVEDAQSGWLMGSNLTRLRMKTEQVDPAYLVLYLSLPGVVDRIMNRSGNATAIPSMSARSFGQLIVVLPPVPEQQHIVTMLQAMDAQVAAHQELALATLNTRTAMADHLIGGPFDVD